MNALDRLIGVFAPATALRRATARAAIERIARFGAGGYEAADRGRRTANWRARATGPNGEIGAALELVRGRVRDQIKNEPYARRASRKYATSMVGTGIRPRPDLETGRDGRPTRSYRAAQAAWDAFAERADPSGQMDFYGQQWLAAKAMFDSGEVLLVWEPTRNAADPWRVTVVEGDCLDLAKNDVSRSGGGRIVQGVEFDADGRRVAYWLFPTHPGEGGQVPVRATGLSVRKEARFVDHLFDADRPGQVRGMPAAVAVALGLRDLGDFDYADLQRRIMEACIGLVFESGGQDPLGVQRRDLEAADGASAGAAPRDIEEMSPGMIARTKPGEKVTTVAPTPSGGYPEATVQRLHRIAAGLGMPYHVLTGDVRKANYSSLRTGMLDWWDEIDRVQQLVLVPLMCRRAWRRVMEADPRITLRAAGAGAVWCPPKRHWVDPVKDIEGVLIELGAGLESWPDAVQRRGLDPVGQITEIAEWRERLAAAGIVLGKPAASSKTPAAAAADDDDDETDEETP